MVSRISDFEVKKYALKYKKNLTACMNERSFAEEENLFFDPNQEAKELLRASQGEKNEGKRFILKVNFALSCMEKKKAMILWKEYFFQVERFWWMRYYTRSSFYRLRKKAIEEFLCLME